MQLNIVTQVNQGQGLAMELTETIDGEGSLNLAPVECDGEATTELIWAADVSQIQSLVIQASGPCTIRTNDADTPDNTIALTGDKRAYRWTKNSPEALLLTTDVDSLHVVVAGSAAVTLQIMGNYDPTP